MNTSRVRILTRLEDANLFTDPKEAEAFPNDRSILGQPVMSGERFISIRRVDYFRQDEIVALPKWQADALIALGYAEAAR